MSATLLEVLPPLPQSGCPSCVPIEAENDRLRRGLKAAEGSAARLQKQLDESKAEIAKLKALLDDVRRKGKRQSRPFSKGDPKPDPKKSGRKSGEQHGRHGHREPPDHVDETVEVLPPERCPHCGGEIETEDEVSIQYQADVPPIRPHVTQFNCREGRCKRCRRPVRGRDPRQNSSARGAAASHVGPRAMALATLLHTGLGLSFGKVSAFFAMVFNLKVTRGALAQIQDRAALKAAPTYRALVRTVQHSPVVVPDETGWHVGGRSAWLWVFVTPEITVYLVATGRGFEDACEVLPADFAGMLTRDGWGVYRQYVDAVHQTCLQHIDRRCRELLETAKQGAARVPHAVQRLLQDAYALRRRRDQDEISPHGLLIAIGKLEARAGRLLAWRPTDEENRKLLKHLRHEHELEPSGLFAFLHHPELPATNHWAEQEIRPAVVTRKVWGGNRTWNGACAQEILSSVLRTGQRQGRDPIALQVPIYCSPTASVADIAGLWMGPDPPDPPADDG